MEISLKVRGRDKDHGTVLPLPNHVWFGGYFFCFLLEFQYLEAYYGRFIVGKRVAVFGSCYILRPVSEVKSLIEPEVKTCGYLEWLESRVQDYVM